MDALRDHFAFLGLKSNDLVHNIDTCATAKALPAIVLSYILHTRLVLARKQKKCLTKNWPLST